MEHILQYGNLPSRSYGGRPDGSDEVTALSNAVELARHLTGARIAWLMLPAEGEGASPLQLVAVSEHKLAEPGKTPEETSSMRALNGAPPDAARAAGVGSADLPTMLPFSRKTPTRAEQNVLSAPVHAGGPAPGMLIVAEPLSHAGFGQDALKFLEMQAAAVTDYLTLVATQHRTSRMRRSPRLLRQQVFDALEDERHRIARDLHDEMGHTLSAAILRIDLAAMSLAVDAAQTRDSIERARASLVACAEALHGIVFHLRPPILEDLGLAAALNRLVAEANEVTGTRIVLTVDGQVRQLPEGLDLVVFRIVQEALTNIRKHAHATEATVRLQYTARWLLLRVEDNGVGIHSQAERPRKGAGLAGMRERTNLFGGELQVESRKRGGTGLVARLPLPTAHRGEYDVANNPRDDH
jgi:signal transduction histidine kinase